jgi:pimeloyl-ACP methyl ester carboxylesterase
MPGLVLLPGMDGTGELFAPFVEVLPPEIEVTVVRYADRPASYADHEAVVRRELPKDRPFVIVGESFSGPVAVSLAANGAANLRGLILCASFLTCPNRLLRALRPLTVLASPKLVPGFIAHHALLGRFATPPLREAHARALSHVSTRTLTGRLRAMSDVDVRDELRRCDLPALYLRATQDRVVSSRYGDEFMATAPRGLLVEIDAPHFLLQTRPREAAREILAFLADIERNPTNNIL